MDKSVYLDSGCIDEDDCFMTSKLQQEAAVILDQQEKRIYQLENKIDFLNLELAKVRGE